MDRAVDHPSRLHMWAIVVSLCLVPFLFFPVIADPFTRAKWIVFLILGTATLGGIFVRAIIRKKIVFSTNPFISIFLPVIAALTYNLLFVSKNRVEALIDPFGLPTWLSFVVIITFLPPLLTRHAQSTIRWFLGIVGGLLGLLAIYQALGIPSLLGDRFSLLSQPLFTPFGSPIDAIVGSLLLLPNFVRLIQDARKSRSDTAVVLIGVSLILSVLGTVSLMVRSADVLQTSMLPISYAWSVMLDSWKQLPQAISGVGFERYLPTYLLHRPQEINATDFWNAGFSYGPTMILDTAVTQGVIGISALCAMIALFIRMATHIHARYQSIYHTIAVSMWIISLFLAPPLPVAFFLLSILLVTYDESSHQSIGVRPLGYVVLAMLIIPLLVGGSFLMLQMTRAEYGRSMVVQYVSSGNTARAYNEMTHVVAAMPMVSNYHITMSQLTISAVQALLVSSTPDETGQVSDEDAALVSTLANQAVSEAKRATILSPDNALMWAHVARVYQALIGNAQNADQYTVASYRQAIALDPINPTLHMDLGVVLAGLKQYDAALNEVRTALALKPDYPNAVYNLANIYRVKGDYDNANSAIEQLKKMTANDQKSLNQITELEDQIRKDKEASMESATPTLAPTPTP